LPVNILQINLSDFWRNLSTGTHFQSYLTLFPYLEINSNITITSTHNFLHLFFVQIWGLKYLRIPGKGITLNIQTTE